MTATRFHALQALILAAVLTSAGGVPIATAATTRPPAATQPSKDPYGDLLSNQRQLAKDAEGDDDLAGAVAHWEYIASASPNDPTAKTKIASLKKLAQDRAAQYFKTGFAQYDKGNIGPAFKALLKGLSYDPANEKAVRLVKDELNAKSVLDYKVEKGDTLASIAEKNKKEGYDDPNLVAVIARYNGLKDKQQPAVGQVLKIPVMVGVLYRAPGIAIAGRSSAQESEDTSELDDTKSNAAAEQARDLLKQNKFDQAAKVASQVLDEDPLNKDAKDVRNAANMGLGKQLLDAKKFEAALGAFSRVDPAYPQQKESVALARSNIQDKAELTYQEGVKYFLADDLDNAIKSFQACLQINPNHPQAKQDMQTAIETRDKLRNLK